MICLFNNKATKENVMTTNGDYILDPIVSKCEINEELNKDFSARLTVKLNNEFKDAINSITEDCIITLDDEEGKEFFRVVNITKSTNYIDVFMVHITIRDIINMWCESVRPTNQTGQGALSWIFDNAKGGHNFNVTSNITKTNTAYYEAMSVYNALYGADNSFISRWGGETLRRGYNITINDRIGADRGMQIRSKKNLTGFEAKTNLDNLCTCLYVKGFDGLKLDSPINSPLINNYSKPYYKELKFEDVKVKNENNPNEGFDTEAQAKEELRRRGQAQFTEKNIDVIKATYNIKFLQLEDTEEYKEYSMIEKAFLGDTVEVIEDNYNVNIKVRVIGRKYDVLTKKRIETTLSNEDISDKPLKVEDLLKELEEAKDGASRPNLGSYIDSMITSGLKDSYVILKPNELLIMDSKDIQTAKNVCRYNKNGLGFSQTGYFGKYEYGFTIDGKINASMITVGLLSANLIRAGVIKGFNDDLIIDLDNGIVTFKKGLIQGKNVSMNLDTGEIRLTKGLISGLNSNWNLDTGKVNFTGGTIGNENLVINLDTGEVNFKKGLIQGDSMELNLDTGSFKSMYYNPVSGEQVFEIKNGKLTSTFDMDFRANGFSFLVKELNGEDIYDAITMYKSMTLSSPNEVHLTAPIITLGKWDSSGEVNVKGQLKVNGSPVTSRIAALENLKLQEEGLI